MAIIPSDHSPVSKSDKHTRPQASAAPKNPPLNQPKTQPQAQADDKRENVLRPTSLENYIGQDELKQNLNIMVAAARKRNESLNHLLFYGPPGLGKTTISMLIAQEMDAQIRILAAPALERPRDIIGLLMQLQPRDILFIDEIHRLNKVTEEYLYPAMEDYVLDLAIGKGPSARVNRMKLNPFTLIGATTLAGAISSPLRTRFGFVHRLRFYTPEEMQTILLNSAKTLKCPLTPEGALAIARRSRGTPRVGNRLLQWVRDYAEVHEVSPVDAATAETALDLQKIDHEGLEPTDRELLQFIIQSQRSVGLKTLAAALQEDEKTIEDVYEPYLIQRGFLQRTPRGRVVTPSAYHHLGLEPVQEQLGFEF